MKKIVKQGCIFIICFALLTASIYKIGSFVRTREKENTFEISVQHGISQAGGSVKENEGEQRGKDVEIIKASEREEKHTANIPVQWISQYPELPTGCEVTCLTMLMNYYGYPVTKTVMASEYLPKGEGDFREKFVGNPFSEQGFGCYAKPIVTAANRYFKEKNVQARAVNISNSSFETLLDYVRMGIPVITWNTMNMQPSYDTRSWETEKGTVTWRAPEHCVVLIGYNLEARTVWVADPVVGIVERDLELFQHRYQELYSQAVYITAN